MQRALLRCFVVLLCLLPLPARAAPAPVDLVWISVGKMLGDDTPAEFSIQVKLEAREPVKPGWQLGFFMPSPLVRQGRMNERLEAEIHEDEGRTMPLTYLRAGMSAPDLSAGYTSVLEAAGDFPLRKGHAYTLAIRHANTGAGGNLSCAPQSFFLVAPGERPVTLSVGPERYRLLDVSAAAVQAEIKRHVQASWDASSDRRPPLDVVPAPLSCRRRGPGFDLRDSVRIHDALRGTGETARVLARILAAAGVRGVRIDHDTAATTGIVLQRESDGRAFARDPEGYRLDVRPRAVVIGAQAETGAFYAVQTLAQLLHGRHLEGVLVVDRPRFRYRGVLLDVARHFFAVADVERFLDVMAAHKLNTLHLHLGDDEGFRLDLAHPGYAGIGGTRGYGRPIGPMVLIDAALDRVTPAGARFAGASTIYRGAYTRADVARLVAYANRLHITVIPEIDMPGHARAMIKSRPDAFVDPADRSRYVSVQGFTDNVLPVYAYGASTGVGPRFTRATDDLVREIVGMFAGQSTVHHVDGEISVGGDEVSTHAWTDVAGLPDAWRALSSIQKSHRFFSLLGARHPKVKLSGWQQLVQDDNGAFDASSLPASKTAHVWAWLPADSGGLALAQGLARRGYPTVLAFADRTYFDLAYTPDVLEPGFAWATKWSDTYAALRLSPTAGEVLAGLPAAARGNVVGLEGALWSEELPSRERLMYMALPKMAGLAEAAWSPASLTDDAGRVDWRSLASRLGDGQRGFLAWLHRVYGVRYRGFPHGIALDVPPAR